MSALWCPLATLPSYLDFSYLGRGVSLHGCSSKAQPLLLTLDEGYVLTTTLPDLHRGMAPLGPPAPVQPLLLGYGVPPPGCRPWPRVWGCSSRSPPLTSDMGQLLSAALSAPVAAACTNHTRTTALSNSMKLSHACEVIQDERVVMERSHKM